MLIQCDFSEALVVALDCAAASLGECPVAQYDGLASVDTAAARRPGKVYSIRTPFNANVYICLPHVVNQFTWIISGNLFS